MRLKNLLWLASKQIIVLAVCCSWQSKHFVFTPFLSFLKGISFVCISVQENAFLYQKSGNLKKNRIFAKIITIMRNRSTEAF